MTGQAQLNDKGLSAALGEEAGDIGFDVANLLKKAIESVPGSILCDLYKPLMRVREVAREVRAKTPAPLCAGF